MIGSHMKEYSEWGAMVLPKMLEVIIINYADSIDAYFEPGHDILKETKPGEIYQIRKASVPYYKSLNPYYNKLSDYSKRKNYSCRYFGEYCYDIIN